MDAAIKKIYEMTDGLGVDVAIEAVGIPQTFDICQKIITKGGHVANVGVHGKSVELHLEDLWIKKYYNRKPVWLAQIQRLCC